MLFKQLQLQQIKDGAISLAFRKWKRPSAKSGSKIKTAVGLVEIIDVSVVDESDIRQHDAVNAGFKELDDLLSTLHAIPDGEIYRIRLRYAGVDPRIATRSKTTLSNSELEILHKKLQKMDKASKTGSWTISVLHAIEKHPGTRAADLAKSLGIEKIPFKINVRKLKDLGLTISEEVGYTLSPLGKFYLKNTPK